MTFNGQIHPFADRFPMLPEEQLQELAEDIAANGQTDPILLDAEGTLVDGRNRLAACELAGVEPRFQRFDGDPMRLIVSKNSMRRNLSEGQRIMSIAMGMWEEGLWNSESQRWRQGAAKEAKQVLLNSKTSGGRAASDLSNAGKVLAYSPDLAQEVLTGTIGLQAAAEQVKAEQAAAAERRRKLDELQNESPDIYQRVIDGEPLDEGWAAHEARHARRIKEEKERRESRERTRELLAIAVRDIRTARMPVKLPDLAQALEDNPEDLCTPAELLKTAEDLTAIAHYLEENSR